ncbi:hypothetical protein GTQ43_36410 [Nostoc sp. KVJ3]|uniref:hypothetical protein n=1 Tax=Nostoc sp. KVJ3 TaxID=457945 RepID=UPI0022378DA5|nr:hypothetical protein [Nostoc sp. KVJ3]MCW5318933.1 hypothetical protein [Nostoc sp. KVJ3]
MYKAERCPSLRDATRTAQAQGKTYGGKLRPSSNNPRLYTECESSQEQYDGGLLIKTLFYGQNGGSFFFTGQQVTAR